jgi:hypothetical protein
MPFSLIWQDVEQEETSLKEMLEAVVQMIWDNALDYKIVP